MAKRKKNCGSEGGRTTRGAKCTKERGWGTDHLGKGRCRNHDEAKNQRIKELKSRAIELIKDGTRTLEEVAMEIGYKPWQVWWWRKGDEQFDMAITEALSHADDVRVQMAEDHLYTRIMNDKMGSVELIFFLKNRAPSRWKDRVEREITGKDGKALFSLEAIRMIVGED